jgi:ATP-dependent Clp protease ATP-binding subunit ClpB
MRFDGDLKRVIQNELENKIARMIISGEIKDGSTVSVDYKNEEIVLIINS